MIKVLVTGGAGFIGSHVVEALLVAGHEVVVVDNLSSGRREYVPDEVAFHHLDILDGRFPALVAETAPRIIAHLAAQMDVNRSVRQPRLDAEINILGTIQVLEAARCSQNARVVFASTGGAIYGDTDTIPTPEDHPLRPPAPYGTSKAAAELYLQLYERLYRVPSCALRFANIYGPRQDPHGEAGVVAIFARAILDGRPATIHSDGLQTRDFLFVEDAACAVVLAAGSDVTGIFNIGTGRETSVLEIYQSLARITGCDTPPIHTAARTGDWRRGALDCRRARETLGWEPAVGLDAGLRRTVEFFRQAPPR